ncbi:MAG: hypothetical protein ACRC8S_08510 [Fimbriiglobus sp.]
MFELIMCNLAMLTIAMVFYAYRDSRPKAKPNLNERVAYMLWVAAQRNS